MRLNNRFGMVPTFGNLLNEFDQMMGSFDRFVNDKMTPSSNILETDDKFTIEIMAPGHSKENLDINIEENRLIVNSHLESNKEENENNYTYREFSSNSFSRAFYLPENVESDMITADYKDGILVINLPKTKKEIKSPKKIEIK